MDVRDGRTQATIVTHQPERNYRSGECLVALRQHSLRALRWMEPRL